MESDIVTRLRRDCMSLIADEAADEIERLRVIVQGWEHSARNAERDIAQLREERDEARRDRCMARAVIRWDLEHPNSPQRTQTTIILLAWQIADEEGWDCFEGRKR